MIRNADQLRQSFLEKVRFIESHNKNPNFDLETYFVMQVGPEDAKVIMLQMEAFFNAGYAQAMKDITS